jgi:hypothetical protein
MGRAGPNRVEAGLRFDRPPASTSGAFSCALCAPVLELVDRPALHAGDFTSRPGPTPGRGTFFNCRSICRKSQNLSAKP